MSPGLGPVVARLAAAPRLLVACDYDGVLAPLVADPAAAYPLVESIAALRALADLPDTTVAAISGRALADLVALSGLGAPVHLVGSHGAEWSAGNVRGLDSGRVRLLADLVPAVRSIATRHPGTAVETKPASVVLHVRNASPAEAVAALDELERGPLHTPGLHVRYGKQVVELAVVPADKGAALTALRAQTQADTVLFAGDDLTDEDAFARLAGADIGVKVGDGQTVAAYRVADPAAVAVLLTDLLRLRSPTT